MSSNNGLGLLQTDALFLGLTRPALIAGVTFTYFSFEFFVTTLIFIMTSQFRVFIIAIVAHVIGVFLCKKEPLAIDMLLTKIQKTPSTRNKNFHGNLQSYNMFG